MITHENGHGRNKVEKDRFKKQAVDVTFFSNRFTPILLKNSMIRNRVNGVRKKQKLDLLSFLRQSCSISCFVITFHLILSESKHSNKHL